MERIRNAIGERYNHARLSVGMRVLAAMTILTAPAATYGTIHEIYAMQRDRTAAHSVSHNRHSRPDSATTANTLNRSADNAQGLALVFGVFGGIAAFSEIAGIEMIHRQKKLEEMRQQMRRRQLLGSGAAMEVDGEPVYTPVADEMIRTAYFLDDRKRIQRIDPGLGGLPDIVPPVQDLPPEFPAGE